MVFARAKQFNQFNEFLESFNNVFPYSFLNVGLITSLSSKFKAASICGRNPDKRGEGVKVWLNFCRGFNLHMHI